MRLRDTAAALREFALGLPGAYEDFPWGELVIKVKKKVFVFLGRAEDLEQTLRFSVKLPESGEHLLDQPFAEPTGYGLGKSGWVSVSIAAGEQPPLAELCRWIEESYRAVAPKTLVKELEGGRSAKPAQRGAARNKKDSRRKPRR